MCVIRLGAYSVILNTAEQMRCLSRQIPHQPFPTPTGKALFILSSPPTQTRCASAAAVKLCPWCWCITHICINHGGCGAAVRGKVYPPVNLEAPTASENVCHPFLECDIKDKIKPLKNTGSVQDTQTSELRQVRFFPCCWFLGVVQVFLKTSKP